jgi:5-carboxymethyl-2-hydroxymuconate isomerase
MPQIYIEYSDNIKLINFKEISKLINITIAKIVDVPVNRCKARLIKFTDFLIGAEEDQNDAFIFIHAGIQANRGEHMKQQIGDAILDILKVHALPKLLDQKLKCSPRVEVRAFDLYLFSDWVS